MKQKNLLKYGKTFTELSVRFSGNKKLPYSYYLLDSFTFNDAKTCSEYELYLKNKYQIYSYKPLINFKGKTECFDISIKEEIANGGSLIGDIRAKHI